jgi:pentatricopeptide repeat protein
LGYYTLHSLAHAFVFALVFNILLCPPFSPSLPETQDGYVVVTGFTPKASTLVQYAVKVGDRVLAVDSNLGDRMWPVSTVEGVISATTSRLPGQQITFRFERCYDATSSTTTAGTDTTKFVVTTPSGVSNAVGSTINPMSASLPQSNTISKVGSENQLLERCREVMKRYATDEKYINKFALPGLVADKVVYALASAETRVDAVTLSMIQAAYLSCKQPQMVIQVFQSAVGLKADGSTADVNINNISNNDSHLLSTKRGEENPLVGKDGKQLKPNLDALDVYTASALLKAYAMMGDLSSVQRVLAALEGHRGVVLDNLEAAEWPGTGPHGPLQPDTQCYNMVISAAANSGTNDGLTLALELFEKLHDPSTTTVPTTTTVPQKDSVSYNTVIKALTNNGRFQEAIETFYQMKKVGVRPDKYSYTSLIKAVMVDADVEELLYDMKEEGVNPDVKTFNTIIKNLCEQKKIAAAKKIVGMMDTSGVAPDSWTYGYLMKGLMDGGNPSAALTLFETACSDRRTVGATENVHLYTTAMSAAAAVGDHSRALELLSRMKTIGIKPNLKTLTALLGACLAAQKPELAVDVFRRIPDPDTFAVTQGLIAMAKAGQCDKVLTMLLDRESMAGKLRGKGLMKVYETLFQASIGAGNYAVARNVTNSLLRGGNLPSKALFLTIIETMGLLPSKGLFTRITFSSDGLIRRDGIKEEDIEKFLFLLFLLDSIAGRKLPCEASLYSAVLSFGIHLGGLPKKIAALIVTAKEASGVFANRNKLIDEERREDACVASGWEDLFVRYDALKSEMSGPSSLPQLEVRIASREVVKVLRAEKNLSYSTQKRNSKR